VILCPLCGNDRSTDFPLYYLFQEKRFQTKRCLSCSFVFVDPRPTDSELARMYSDEYFLHDGADFGAHSATDYETAAIRGSAKFPEILEAIRRFKDRGDFFEVGCGMGYFLKYASEAGYHATGIEYSKLGTELCKQKFGLDVQCNSFEHYDAHGAQYDVIFMGDVLEHLVGPLKMLEKAKRMLKPRGIVALELPSMFNCISGRLAASLYPIIGKHKKMPMPPYHVNEFVPRTIKAMLVRAGFSRPVVIQRIKHPKTITLRGSWMEKTGKKLLQYPNYFITNSFGLFGDRLLAIGINDPP
jgi:SAM-dependent methyltransferase